MMACFDRCHCIHDKRQSSILYSILKNDNQKELHVHEGIIHQGCSCGSKKKVVLKCPQVTCKTAFGVLVKTLKFIKNVPCFQELPVEDQLLLVRSCWAPLLVLGLAQDRVDFEVIETSEPSMLQMILTNSQEKLEEQHLGNHQPPSSVEIQSIKSFLTKCWNMDISTKEYAYLKGTILFKPDLPGLHCSQYIQGLQREAQQALNEYIKMIYCGDQTRFTKLIIVLSMLRSINANVIAELFFRPIIGTININDMLVEMLSAKI
ncbi:nuclear receptor subfamily 0 group B member 1 [Protopterus annectens]|uniref:DAX1 n=1 Tax=Protopterus annectens TaxID=7888 RepID=A0A2U9NL24_PROAN|nr:nuclear receptor subfamily 0 group B member 1 [Protopterus annectens]AWT24630.1 DAX1 [Protopterus annectens]